MYATFRRLRRGTQNRRALGRKKKVMIYLYEDEVEMLDLVCERTGDTRSELMRRLLRNYLDQLNLMRERVHSNV
jgi:metal-responsive CopG/Arc/MetJ family transcriptional regulator